MKIFVLILILCFFIACMFVSLWVATTEFKTKKETDTAIVIVVTMLVIGAVITALFPVIERWIKN